ncbi:uncharacterized protein LOC112517673 [Cynara cardunculus var. scolymus]|uniref:Uncharacterized protein n=1 Tax=Cynara cardunculus var. scolymus TaxID=59895 RepID=A0A103XPQ9_CYNCS|nr:uncharacterized protein LOC112517673 [Cynara cardunculus var. scolymus]XP_024980824.1 uncharacterized protein LOC112517673 [Cynara cardunculus var. scolymus]KVH94666.1 Protein of unknown function DUF3527 [Cynara cardunculus var. scolymus]
MAASASNHGQKRRDGNKRKEIEEIVRHMSNLPSYLERGKPIQDRALNFGVMDWGRLEKWQYHHQKQGLFRSNKCSPSSSNSSLLFSTDGSSPHSTRGQSSSPASLKPHRVTLQSSLNISPEEISSRFVKSSSGNLDKSQDVKDALLNYSGEKRTTNRSRNKPRGCNMDDSYPRNRHESKSSDDLGSFHTASSSPSSKGKKKIQDELVNELGNLQDPSYGTCDGAMHKTVVLLPRDAPRKSRTNGEMSKNIHSDPNNGIPRSFPSETEAINRKKSQNEAISERNSTEERESSFSSNNSNFKTDTIAASKQRSISPLRRFNFSMSSKSAALTSANTILESPPASRTHSSPLRRLLDPLFPSKSPEDSTIKAKVKLDLRSCKEVRVDDSHMTKMNESSSTKQALFQIAVKNGRPFFTFAVDNNINILAATVRSLSGKDDSNGWIYTFFTIHEVKKKKSGWLSQGTKGTAQGYHPNITAQMKVSNPSISSREFVLSSVDPNRLDHQVLDGQPQDELAAIVVRFLREADDEEDQDCFSTTVILPGGHHSVPSKGEPSPLIDRWRSGGVCDCGGWDMGCRLRTLANKVQSTRSKSPEAHMTSNKFELFFQGEVPNERPFFSLSPLKEGIFSVEYNSSLSLLHAFSICISVIECRKSCQHTELKTYVAKRVDDDEAPVTYASFPPLSLVERV